jgi:hypothetical protein
VPTYITGTFDALPRDRRVPKFHRITVAFGRPEPVESLRAKGVGHTEEERTADALRQCVIALAIEAQLAAIAGQASDRVSDARD